MPSMGRATVGLKFAASINISPLPLIPSHQGRGKKFNEFSKIQS
jgi:hypothetical protein